MESGGYGTIEMDEVKTSRKRRFWRNAFFVALVLFLAGTVRARYIPPYRGVVLEYGTDRPLEGAQVIAVYQAWDSSFGGEVSRYLAYQAVKTDKEGRFRIPWRFFVAMTTGGGIRPWADLNIYHPGYANFPGITESPLGIRKNPADWKKYISYDEAKGGEWFPPSRVEVVYRLPKSENPGDQDWFETQYYLPRRVEEKLKRKGYFIEPLEQHERINP